MKCEDLLRMLNDYVDGDIDMTECEQFQKELDGCNPCKVVVDTISRTIRLYKDGAVYELSPKFHDKLHSALRDKWKECHSCED